MFEFMRNHSDEFPIIKMAKVLKVSRAGYYQYIDKSESEREKRNKELTIKIKTIFENSRQNYGSPRVCAALRNQGESCSRKRVAKIMRQNRIQAKIRRKWKASSMTTRDLSIMAPNLLKQNFIVSKANAAWVHDITYIKTNEGWLYVSAVLDLYSRKIVGLSMGSCIDTRLVIRSLEQAICHRSPLAGLILHSDRGTQYTSHEYKIFTQKAGIILSMSAQGNCYDNAVIESFFHTLKTEHVFFYAFRTRQEAIRSIFEYIEVYYNRQRAHSTLNYLSPQEFEWRVG
ncbi:MAG TPA: IS3 family transposase [Candidatus Babeliales bacterium]|nr:IS3 family transposase [Candidatus Babeliales bacterium]